MTRERRPGSNQSNERKDVSLDTVLNSRLKKALADWKGGSYEKTGAALNTLIDMAYAAGRGIVLKVKPITMRDAIGASEDLKKGLYSEKPKKFMKVERGGRLIFELPSVRVGTRGDFPKSSIRVWFHDGDLKLISSYLSFDVEASYHTDEAVSLTVR